MKRSAIPDLSSRELQTICMLAECGSFKAASLTLEMSQPSLTRAVQRVEQALGLELFRRTTRRVEVTSAGEEFIALAKRVLNDLRISCESMREVSDEERGQVIVSSVMSMAYTQLPTVVSRYRAMRPGVEIELREGVHGTVLEDVRSGIADFGITYTEDIPPELLCIPLSSEAFHVVVPKHHPLAKKDGFTLDELTRFALVSLPREAQTRRLIDGLASAAGLTLQHAVTVRQFATVMRCVQADVGIALVPGGAIPTALNAGLACVPLTKPVITRTIGIVMLKDRGLTPSARSFLGQLRPWRVGEACESSGRELRFNESSVRRSGSGLPP